MTCSTCRHFDRVPGDSRGFCANPALDPLILMPSTLCIEETFGCIFWEPGAAAPKEEPHAID